MSGGTKPSSFDSLVRILQLIGVIAAVVIGCIYMNASPVDPIAFELPSSPIIKENNILSNAELLWKNRRIIKGPESFAVHPNGDYMYFGTTDGRLVRVPLDRPRSSQPEIMGTIGDAQAALPLPCGTYDTLRICGRPLGMVAHPNGDIYFVDAYFGAFVYKRHLNRIVHIIKEVVVPKDKSKSRKAERIKMAFPNDIAIAPNGKVYVTVSSNKYQLHDIFNEVLEGRPNGYVVEYDPKTGRSTMLADGLHFPNGVVVNPGGDYIIVAETTRARLVQVDIRGPRKGQVREVISNLPYLPDNIRYVGKELWVAGGHYRANNRFSMYDWLADKPALRKLASKAVPARYQQIFSYLDKSSGITRVAVREEPVVVGTAADYDVDEYDYLDAQGEMIDVLQDQQKRIKWLSHVQYHDGYIYLGSYHADVHAVARIPWNLDTMTPAGHTEAGQYRKLRRKEVEELRKKNKEVEEKVEL